MARETWVQSLVESYQRLRKWHLITPCLTLSIIRYRSRVKWSNPGNGVASSPTLWCSSYLKGRLGVTLNYDRQFYFIYIYVYIYIYIYIYMCVCVCVCVYIKFAKMNVQHCVIWKFTPLKFDWAIILQKQSKTLPVS